MHENRLPRASVVSFEKRTLHFAEILEHELRANPVNGFYCKSTEKGALWISVDCRRQNTGEEAGDRDGSKWSMIMLAG